MERLLLNKLIKSVLRVEISREPGASTARLLVKNDVKIDRDLRTRGKRLKIKAVDIPDSADVLFQSIIEQLEGKGLRCSSLQRKNLPELPPDQTDFSAEAIIAVGEQEDKELHKMFAEAANAAESAMAAGRFRRKAGNWTDRKGGTGAGTIGL